MSENLDERTGLEEEEKKEEIRSSRERYRVLNVSMT